MRANAAGRVCMLVSTRTRRSIDIRFTSLDYHGLCRTAVFSLRMLSHAGGEKLSAKDVVTEAIERSTYSPGSAAVTTPEEIQQTGTSMMHGLLKG